MINKVKTTYKKIVSLENKVEEIELTSNSKKTSSNCVSFAKNYLNFEVLVSKKFLLAEFEVKENSSIYLQNHIELNLAENQKVKFSLIVNGVFIHKSTKELSAGFNTINLMKTYTPILTEKIEVYLQIVPEYGKSVILTSENLTVWGIEQKIDINNYQAIESDENYLLAYQNGDSLFYALVPKEINGYFDEDFEFWGNVKSFSFVFDSNLKKFVLFYVDRFSNLFMFDFESKNNLFLQNNVSYVSAVSNTEIILITYIKNNKIFYFEIDSSYAISDHNALERMSTMFETCYAYFNEYNQHFIVVAKNVYGANFLFESENAKLFNQMSLTANYTFTISTNGVQNEI